MTSKELIDVFLLITEKKLKVLGFKDEDINKVREFVRLGVLYDKIEEDTGMSFYELINKYGLNHIKSRYPVFYEYIERWNILPGTVGWDYFYNLAYWQHKALEIQHNKPDPTYIELYQVSYYKGGYTMCLLEYILTQKKCHNEDVALRVGATIQFIDDYVDAPEDKVKGIKTLFTVGYWKAYDLYNYIKDTYLIAKKTNYKLYYDLLDDVLTLFPLFNAMQFLQMLKTFKKSATQIIKSNFGLI